MYKISNQEIFIMRRDWFIYLKGHVSGNILNIIHNRIFLYYGAYASILHVIEIKIQ